LESISSPLDQLQVLMSELSICLWN